MFPTETAFNPLQKYHDARKAADKLIAKAREEMQKDFRKACDPLFEEYPALQSFGWRQYTPYFNDGDTCKFGVYADYPYVNGLDEDDDDFYENLGVNFQEGTRPYQKKFASEEDEKKYKAHEKMCRSITGFIATFNEEDLKAFFGDHVRVTVHRDGGIKTETYDHN